jgi:ATP-dependent helicase/nuclease subunit B
VTITAAAERPADAFSALAGAIADAKNGDPLEPVTVIVPTNTCGVMTRRALGRDVGVAAVDMVTLNRLAELISGPALATESRSPMSTPVIDLAIAAVLSGEPGTFKTVASHPSTIAAIREIHQELRMEGPAAADRLAARSSRGRQVARVSNSVTEMLRADWYDEADLLSRATGQLQTQLPDGLHHIIVHLPDQLSGLAVDFIKALGSHTDIRIVTQLVGLPSADADTQSLLADLGATVESATVESGPIVESVSPRAIISTTDADDEVRIAARTVLAAARTGTPFERIAILWPAHRPYARLVEHHLSNSGIRWNGRPGTSVTERLAPRLILDLLDVDRRGLRRRKLFDLLADVPARDADGQYLPTAEWERVSREAGVARDDDWGPRLGALADSPRWADPAASLSEFVTDLRGRLGHPARKERWWEWAQWCTEQLDLWLGRHSLERLPESEYRAWESLTSALDRLRHLDPVGDPVTRHQFRATLEAELDSAPAREGRVGDGVTVGPLAGAVGLDVDVTIVLGAAEGILPPSPRRDPLLSDTDREVAGLRTADAQVHRLHKLLLAIVSTSAATLTVPRGDLRATSQVEPSRWITSWEHSAGSHVVDSHHAGLVATDFPLNPHEHRLRARYSQVLAGTPLSPQGVRDDPVLQRGLTLRAARASDDLTEYDGDLSAADIPALDFTVSPSRLETWVACPHAYFMKYLLRVRPVDEPDDEISITALDRGTTHHAALDKFHSAVISGELPQPTNLGWSDVHRTALTAYFHDVSARIESRGRTGRPAFWADEQARMLTDLLDWLDHDSVLVASRGSTVIASEKRFEEADNISIPLSDGRSIRLNGSIDRVDRARDGSLVVTDHKTGSKHKFRGLSADDPTLDGTLFQLPSYAAAAMTLFGGDQAVHAEYGLMAKGDYERLGFPMTPATWANVQTDLENVVDGIEGGYFPSRPERPGWRMFVPCEYCEPDHLGTAERWAEWERKQHDPRLNRWFGEPPEAGQGDSEPGNSNPAQSEGVG